MPCYVGHCYHTTPSTELRTRVSIKVHVGRHDGANILQCHYATVSAVNNQPARIMVLIPLPTAWLPRLPLSPTSSAGSLDIRQQVTPSRFPGLASAPTYHLENLLHKTGPKTIHQLPDCGPKHTRLEETPTPSALVRWTPPPHKNSLKSRYSPTPQQ